MVVTLSPARRVLTFVRLFPAVAATPGVAPALKQAIASASTRALPAHRRIDPKRARMSGRVSGGDLTLQLTLEAGRASSTVRAALAVVNDLFLLMRECYPDYLTAQFGLPDE